MLITAFIVLMWLATYLIYCNVVRSPPSCLMDPRTCWPRQPQPHCHQCQTRKRIRFPLHPWTRLSSCCRNQSLFPRERRTQRRRTHHHHLCPTAPHRITSYNRWSKPWKEPPPHWTLTNSPTLIKPYISHHTLISTLYVRVRKSFIK